MRIITADELRHSTKLYEFNGIYKVDEKTIVKTGAEVRLAEAEALKYVRKNTTIPVPEVYNAYLDEVTGHTCIVMEFVEGVRLEDAWAGYSPAEKEEVVRQLRSYFTELRELRGSFIGSVDGSACVDSLFDDKPEAYGPYDSEKDFNEGIISALRHARQGAYVNVVCSMIPGLQGHRIAFTHGDIAPRNIIVKGSKVTGIVDWGDAGFYPEYWEYYKAMRRPAWNSEWMADKLIDRIIPPRPVQLAIMWSTMEVIW